jgi:3'-5' exonuclease
MRGTTDNVVLVFDLETVPDVRAFGVAEGLDGHPDWSVRKQMGEKVARQIFQRIVCIGSLLSVRGADGVWRPSGLEAPHAGGSSERELIQDFVDRLLPLGARLVTFNGHTFDMPVLRYRAMMHSVSAPALVNRPYFDRNRDDMVDLCDLLSAQERHARVSLNELARVLGLPGKPAGLDGGQVEAMVQEGRLAEVADYCRSDVVNTYGAWLRYELFRGRVSEPQFAASESALAAFLAAKS